MSMEVYLIDWSYLILLNDIYTIFLFRLELSKRVPCLGINEKPPPTASETQSTTTAA